MMRRPLFATLMLLASVYHTYAQGTLNIALQQQFSFTGCSTAANVCGVPLIGGLLYFYQVGTVSTRQDSFQDPALSVVNPWPLTLDANGRVPMFYLAAGSVHARLTDAGGVVQFDQPALLVVGGTATGTAGAVNPSTETTGDIKFRLGNPSEVIQSWVRLNGQKIGGNGSSGTACTGCDLTGDQYRAVFTYLWVNCANPTTNRHCIVALGGTAGLGASANADWTAGKSLQLPDFRGRGPVGLDDMGNARANILSDANNFFSTGDTGIIPGSTGGQALHTMTANELFAHSHGFSVGVSVSGSISGSTSATHTHNVPVVIAGGTFGTNGLAEGNNAGVTNVGSPTNGESVSGSFSGSGSGSGTTNNTGATTAFNVMFPFVLGTWYMRL